ncbi:MAG: glycosyltransferase [Sporolactobacillus sp.]
MEPNLLPFQPRTNPHRFYLTIKTKFWISHSVSIIWLIFSIYLSLPWLQDLADLVDYPAALLIITGIAYLPGYMNAFLIVSLVLDRQPSFDTDSPKEALTVLIAAHNEEKTIFNTLKYVANQDYQGKIRVLVINNCSSDQTDKEVDRAQRMLNLDIHLLHEKNSGKFHALNTGLMRVKDHYVITLDADTLIHPSAIRFLVARIKNSPASVCAVAGSMLVRNSRESFWTKMQEWDYFLGIASIKRLQGLYQGTLVAQGAFSLYKTDCVQAVNGWPDAIGEDIVLTWRLLRQGWNVYFEPLAAAFTDAPATLPHFAKQRSRWARGMIEGLQEIKPWQQPVPFTKYMTGVNLVMPYLDFTFTFCWMPGLIIACFGQYWIVGPTTLLVLPLTLVSFGFLFLYQRNIVFNKLNLKVRRNLIGLISFILFYQLIMSPVSVWGYLQEFFKLKRRWD